MACTEPFAEPKSLHPRGAIEVAFPAEKDTSSGLRHSAGGVAQPLTQSAATPTSKARRFLFNSRPLVVQVFPPAVRQERDCAHLLLIFRSPVTGFSHHLVQH